LLHDIDKAGRHKFWLLPSLRNISQTLLSLQPQEKQTNIEIYVFWSVKCEILQLSGMFFYKIFYI